jgi:hypothetical protein
MPFSESMDAPSLARFPPVPAGGRKGGTMAEVTVAVLNLNKGVERTSLGFSAS